MEHTTVQTAALSASVLGAKQCDHFKILSTLHSSVGGDSVSTFPYAVYFLSPSCGESLCH